MYVIRISIYKVIPMLQSNQHIKFEALELVGGKYENTSQVIAKYLSRLCFLGANSSLETVKKVGDKYFEG